jgi:peptidoglycan/LPS O-acetylase OafA/YrhL
MSHTVRAFIPNYLSPADEKDVPPHLFQRPFFRLTASGPFMISIFFILSGYVCAIKPIRLSNAGMVDEARRVIASSTFRRVLRIGLPATFGTIFAWALTQIGAFTLAPYVELDGMWLAVGTPKRVPGVFASIYELIRACVSVLSRCWLIVVQYLG